MAAFHPLQTLGTDAMLRLLGSNAGGLAYGALESCFAV
jgi:hypothetical protein